ncbi:5-dehydro-4-deoxyglucarate dehydratase [Nonomuraea diastatica]|uniref:Probable 5-dehydro-4-deoxyglucarate dehydratase n=1 Tax=Nonomuraea diastatica TaxID=1848329 RepID=A0A4R4W6I0_9ACTN|nr:5-dehydro-4-deoxyglucarate dehydratase [Nonomuraea diastatica]TDD14248.1 5-dehydro-4-deoxyglucarate dehydratase [Nonomuraea diastatica]
MPPAASRVAASLLGLLAFPVTPFTGSGDVNLPRFTTHLTEVLAAKPSAIFVACGTGELASLTAAEHQTVVRAAVEHVAGTVPVLAGAGGGTRTAAEFARAAQAAGADGLLVLPPYLQVGPPTGLVAHYRQVAAATDLDVVLYQRGTAIFSPAAVAELAEVDNIVALKDGHGDMELLQLIHAATAGRLPLLNGMPTAEVFARSYAGLGARAYSSAVLAFVPEVAVAFFQAFENGDEATQDLLLREFYAPLADLRKSTPGYAVSLIKAGLDIRGRSAGPVRSPLAEVTPEHREQLARIIDRGLAALSATPVA